MIRLLRILNALRGPYIADDPNPQPSQLDLWDGIGFTDDTPPEEAEQLDATTQDEVDRRG